MAEKFEAPKVGDTVNHVAPNSLKITKVKVLAVNDSLDGRLVTVEVPGKKKNADGDEVETTSKVSVPYRPKDKLAGGTWHAAVIALLLLLGLSASAGLPTFHTLSAYGNAATPATLIFPADPNSQIRVVTVNYSSDTNIGALNFQSGTTAYSLIASNSTTSGITNVINSTNGLAPSTLVFLQHSGVVYTNTISSWGNTGTNTYTMPDGQGTLTNTTTTTYGVYGTGPVGFAATNINYLIVGTGGWGVVGAVNDEIYLGGPVSSINVGAGTNWINGDDLFSGNYGRPVMLQVTPCSITNRLPSASAHYDSASQP